MDIVVDKLSKRFGDNRVLNEFSACFAHAAITCIMGPSGCGKTTLLHLLMGLLEPDEGSLIGVPDKISAVFQEDRLCENFNPVANVRMVCSKETSDETIKVHLKTIGLADRLSLPVKKLSGGMRRRVAVVRAVLAQSDAVILDEPFKGLDDAMKNIVMAYVKDYTKGRTAIVVTHDEDEVRFLGGHLISM